MSYEELRKKYSKSSQRMIDDWEKNEKVASIKVDLLKHDGVKLLLEELSKKIVEISYTLAFEKEMTQEKRMELFVERECYEWLLGFFDNAESTLKNIRLQVEEAMKYQDN